MLKFTLSLSLFFFFVVSPVLAQTREQKLEEQYTKIKESINKFDAILEELEKYADKENISLNNGENIKDVLSFGYMQSVLRHKYPILVYSLSNDDVMKENIRVETFKFLSFFCWFPLIPKDNQKDNDQLKELRNLLTKDYYKQTLYYDIIGVDFQKRQREDFTRLFNQLIEKEITFGDLINEKALQDFIITGK